MGIILVIQTSQPNNAFWNSAAVDFGLPYFSISIALNVLLTVMIVVRLTLHIRRIRSAVGMAGTGGLCKAIITMLIESCAIYTANQLLFVVTWAAGNVAADIFLPILGQTQVRTFPLLRFSDGLSDVTTDWTGHCSTAHHSRSRKQERVDEQWYRLGTYQ